MSDCAGCKLLTDQIRAHRERLANGDHWRADLEMKLLNANRRIAELENR